MPAPTMLYFKKPPMSLRVTKGDESAVRFNMPEITGLKNLGDIRRLLVSKNAAIEADEPLRKSA